MKQNSHFHCKYEDKLQESMRTCGIRTLARVLRLGGAKRRFVLAAAKHSCGETPSWSNREPFTQFFRVQRCCRDLTCFVLNNEKHTLLAMNIVC